MKTNSRGAALIVVLWIVAIMGTIAMLFSRTSQMALKINRNVTEASQAGLLAEAGVNRGIAELVEDALDTRCDHYKESWADNQTAFFDVQLGRGIYRVVRPDLEVKNQEAYGLTDECSKLNVNIANRDMLLQLPNSNEEIVDALLDWIDSDSMPRTFGVEDEYYQSLPEPFLAKNDKLDTLAELLLVRDITLEILYGEDTNTNGILDPNENDGSRSFPLDNQDGNLNLGWYPYVTVYSYEKNVDGEGQRRLNVNSADKQAMQDRFGNTLTEADIDLIINTRNANQFNSVGDLLNIQSQGGDAPNSSSEPGIITKEKLRAIIDKITVSDDEKLFGRVNINTAPETVLRCLLPNNDRLVRSIVEYRQSSGAPFDDIGELLDVQGISDNDFKQLTNLVCTKSSVFSIRSIGMITDSKSYKEIYAILDRGGETPQILYWKVMR